MSLLLSHWYPGSGVYLIVSIPDLCTLSYFKKMYTFGTMNSICEEIQPYSTNIKMPLVSCEMNTRLLW